MNKFKINQAVILAGGLGTRLRPITNEIPKPMIRFHDKPFLEYLIERLKENGIEEVVLLLGFLPDKIVDYFKNGEDFGIKINYSIGKVEDKTGTRIRNAKDLIDDHFILMYCDNLLPINFDEYFDFYDTQKTSASVIIYTNKDGFSKNNIKVGSDNLVIKYDKSRRDTDLSGVEIGFFIFKKEKIINLMPAGNFSFEKKVIPPLVENNDLSGFLTDQRYYSIGNLERLKITEEFLRPKKVIFLDRDGVINKKAPKADYIKSWDEFEFLPGVLDGIKVLTQNNYQIYIISNQAGIARGMMTQENLTNIHRNMISEIEKNGGRIDDIYYCPHGWGDNCDCRKPKPGMFYQASREHHIDLSKSFFIGDDERDKLAGDKAGIKTFLVKSDGDFIDMFSKILESEKNNDNYGKILEKLLDVYYKTKDNRFLISIAGCSRSGKTTLARKIKSDLNNKGIKSRIISLDNWLLGLNERKGNETVRERFKYEEIAKDIKQIKSGEKIYPPIYDAKTRKVITKKRNIPLFLEKNTIGIVDGIVSLDIEDLRTISNFKIFVDIDDETRKNRLIKFYKEFKKYSVEEAKRIVEPREHDEVEIIKKAKDYADFIYLPKGDK